MSYYHGPTDNPVRDFEAYDADFAIWVCTRPICAGCDEPIQTETCYAVNGKKFCRECGQYAWEEIRRHYLAPTVE